MAVAAGLDAYLLSASGEDRRPIDPALLGNKGAGLVRMARLGLPVPPAFILPAPSCRALADDWPALSRRIDPLLAALERDTGRRFGSAERPLLLSVRSGARSSMPGMLATVLNVGQHRPGEHDDLFAWNTYVRLLRGWGDVVAAIPDDLFEDALEMMMDDAGAASEDQLDAVATRDLADRYARLLADAGEPLPPDPREQLRRAILAVIASWDGPRAVDYRRLHGIAGDEGTAVTVQAMVFGNRDDRSASGVAFSRDPTTGAPGIVGEYLMRAQGQEIVSGQRTPRHLTRGARVAADAAGTSFEEAAPEAFARLQAVTAKLETQFTAVQEVEWTVEGGQLWLLQTRAARLSPAASLATAVALAEEGLIPRPEAIARVDDQVFADLLRPVLDPAHVPPVIGTGLPASPGVATGIACFTADAALACAARGQPALLIRTDTSPDDVAGVHAAAGLLTSRGGMTSHAAVVARGLRRPCVTGVAALAIDAERGRAELGGERIAAGDWMTIDGTTGTVMRGPARLVTPEPGEGPLATLLAWRRDARLD